MIYSPSINDELYAGINGDLIDNGRPSNVRTITFDQLLTYGLEPHKDIDDNTVLLPDLCKVVPTIRNRKPGQYPLIFPSVELYGAIMGLRTEEIQPPPDSLADDSITTSTTTTLTNDGTNTTPTNTTPVSSTGSSSAPSVTYSPLYDRNLYTPYRWMFSPQHDRATILEDRLDELTVSLLGNHQQKSSTVSVGRVYSDVESNDKLSESNISIELSRKQGNTKIDLDLHESNLKNFKMLFPGQIIAVNGVAPTGDKMIVNQLFTDASPSRAFIPYPNALALHKARSNAGPIRVWIGAGPYTSNNDFEFAPLDAMCEAIRNASPPPDVLILQGPFIDTEHPLLKANNIEVDTEEGKLPVSVMEAWKDVFLVRLAQYLGPDSPAKNIEVILMPSTNDAICEPVYPQWPLDKHLFDTDFDDAEMQSLLSRLTVLPNPATFVIGDTIFGGTTANVLTHLNIEAQRRINSTMDDAVKRYDTLIKHIIEQRNYYPLFPSGTTPGETAPLPLELPKMWHTGMNVRPDILLLPTTKYGKAASIRAVGETLVINPGPVAKPGTSTKAAAGTCTKLCIFPGNHPSMNVQNKELSLDNDDSVNNNSYIPTSSPLTRIRAEIVKLQL